MIRKFVDWILYSLHIKRRIYKPPLETLAELIPIIYAACIIFRIFKCMPKMELSLWQRLIRLIKHKLHYLRFAIIGY